MAIDDPTTASIILTGDRVGTPYGAASVIGFVPCGNRVMVTVALAETGEHRTFEREAIET